MSIEKLHAMPTHTKGEGGYFYEPKYVNRLFQFENKLIYFTESSFSEFPLEFYNVIMKDTKNELDSILKEFQTVNSTLYEKIDNLQEDLDNKIKKLALAIATTKSEFQELKEEVSSTSRIVSSLNNIDESTINSMIDKKLEAVYRSFEKLSEKFVKENMDNALKDSKREASGKLKIASLAIFKELGYSPAEIKDLAESGLI